jgi:hypothetical protein
MVMVLLCSCFPNKIRHQNTCNYIELVEIKTLFSVYVLEWCRELYFNIIAASQTCEGEERFLFDC